MFDEIEDLERFIRFLDSLDNTEFDSDLSDVENEEYDDRYVRMKPFYETRKDIFTIFNDEQIRETFRFDKESIHYITSKFRL